MNPFSSWRREPVLVLGETGLLGQALMRWGSSIGLQMRGASRRSKDISIDLVNTGDLRQMLDMVTPGTIINAAAFVAVDECDQHPDLAYLVNARLPGVLAEECGRRSIRLIQISTDHFFTGDGRAPHSESSPISLVNEYARTKYDGECLALTYPMSMVVRTNIVGFRGWPAPTYAEWLLDSLANRVPIPLFDDFYTSSITTTQFSEALFRLLDTPFCGRINLAAHHGSTKLEFAEALAEACGFSTSACSRGSHRDLPGAPRAESLVLDVSLAEKLLGDKLPDRAAVIEQIVLEYRQRADQK